MDIAKIIGVGLIGTILVIILKQYKPEFAVPASLICGIIIFFLIVDKLRCYCFFAYKYFR